MGQWLSWVKSNENEILKILDDLASKAVETSEALLDYLDDLGNLEKMEKVRRLESEADVFTRDVFAELNKTFITPLDREDMQRIASKIDDVIDFVDGIAARQRQDRYLDRPLALPERSPADDDDEHVARCLARLHRPVAVPAHEGRGLGSRRYSDYVPGRVVAHADRSMARHDQHDEPVWLHHSSWHRRR